MPSAEENRRHWSDYEWPAGGDEWSVGWGSNRALWFESVLPRIHFALPAGHVLEIAPGYGRVTAFLLEHCTRYTGVDLTPRCVEACRERFAGRAEARFFLTDGRSLDDVEDDSVDLAFSWDSLVHADPETLEAYAHGLARKLRPGGLAFLHHSNVGAYTDPATGEPTIPNPHWRDPRMSAERLQGFASASGLSVLAQELVQWGTENPAEFVDAFSWLRRPRAGERPHARPHPPLTHPHFGVEGLHGRWMEQNAAGVFPPEA